MAAAESLTLVRTRIGRQIAEIETRAARRKPVDIGARMAAIRAVAARHDMIALRRPRFADINAPRDEAGAP